MPKKLIEIDEPEGYEVESIGMLNCYDDKKYKCVYFKPKQPEFIEVREYLLRCPFTHRIVPAILKKDDSAIIAELESLSSFYKWIDPDWRRVEI